MNIHNYKTNEYLKRIKDEELVSDKQCRNEMFYRNVNVTRHSQDKSRNQYFKYFFDNFSKRENIFTPFFSKILLAERFLLLCKFIYYFKK